MGRGAVLRVDDGEVSRESSRFQVLRLESFGYFLM